MALQENEAKIARSPFHSNPDILDEICEYLHDGQDTELDSEAARTSRRNLLCVALTCKAFLEPALDRRWRSLDSLFPLLRILPSFTQSDGTYVLRGNVADEDWERFDYYARRLRKFCYTRDPENLDIAMHVYFRLAQLRPTPLLRSLRHLHCPFMSQSDFLISGICLFLSPSLQSLQLENISNVEDKLCGTVLHALGSDGAQIEKIVLRGNGLSMDTVWKAVRFEHLNLLELSGMGKAISLEIMEKIGSLPWLVNLVIDFTESPMAPLTQDIGLKDLKSLIITAPVPFIEALLSHIATTQLETFVAAMPSNPPADKKEFLTKVVDRWGPTLRRIELVHQQLDEAAAVEHLQIDALSPLVPLRKLTCLRLEGYTMELTDEDVSDIAVAWPEMDTLVLPFVSVDHPCPTVLSLRIFARLCPSLRYLTVPLNTEEFQPFVSTGVPHIPAHDLHTLTISSADDPWDLRDMLHIARHIDYLFPRLKSLFLYDRHGRSRWMQVHDMIQMYQAVRQEAIAFERASMGSSTVWNMSTGLIDRHSTIHSSPS
ncbi:hypothetical protein BYT27DRAFT_7077944 [Phlegmacium glaucopus]|nr:hypothetical protein BYT27DRAFT_7077944 [Phlegmacium glaucopus]